MKLQIKKNYPLIILSLLFSISAHALVDYTDTVTDNSDRDRGNGSMNKMKSALQESKSSKGLIWKSDFSFNTNYESRTVNEEKMGVLNFNTHLQTPFNVYLDLSYWNASTKAGSLSGNPKGILGFNWLRLGSPSDEARFDLYGGAKLGGKSILASSRTDKIFGVETTKRFGTFGLGLGYEMTLTGTPKNAADMNIGNIQRISLSAGWMVSNDIQFEVEVENFKIAKSNDLGRSNILLKNVSFSTLSPKLNLSLAQGIGLEMGARFRTQKPKTDQDLTGAKLFDLHGAYSNSLFAGLNLSL